MEQNKKEVLISLKNITKVYGHKKVLDNFNFEIYKGDRIAYLGGNGSGKTTTVEIMAKVKKPTSGEVYWHPNLKVGIQFQESKYPAGVTVQMLINFYLDSFGREGITQEYLDEMIQLFRLDKLQKKEVYQLSGGQQQRINIMLSLIHKPNFLILDELSTGLDIKIRREVRGYIIKYLDQNPDCSLILITHHVSEALRMCNKIVILDKGQIFENDTIENLEQKYGKIEPWIDRFFEEIYAKEKEEKETKNTENTQQKENFKTKLKRFFKKDKGENK
ncbi:ABC transporter ATP-binding protein [Mycoplasma procyoni]|uniref:ABC transporter ATP-binding protein n=1 Tax=Mycoplasma procyoni TaxID=568784 RepID=UPI00197B771C|nr:ABC transporter ATP-binding protein [Mycoplasma procyoni]MBN3534872.1 ABC transporter ATP-binding protein [Mycoplasma procyoni]